MRMLKTRMLGIWNIRSLIGNLVRLELRSGVARRKFGLFWWLLDPILLLGIYWVLVVVVLDVRRSVDEPYPLFLFSGLLFWKWFSTSISRGGSSLAGRAHLIKSVSVPKVAFPISIVLASCIPWILGTFILSGLSLAFGRPIFSLNLLQSLPLLFISFVTLASGAIIMSVVTVYFRDLAGLTPHVLRAGYYLSPGLWSLELLSERLPDVARTVYLWLNPVAVLMSCWRRITFSGAAIRLEDWVVVCAQCLILFISSILVFDRYDQDVARHL